MKKNRIGKAAAALSLCGICALAGGFLTGCGKQVVEEVKIPGQMESGAESSAAAQDGTTAAHAVNDNDSGNGDGSSKSGDNSGRAQNTSTSGAIRAQNLTAAVPQADIGYGDLADFGSAQLFSKNLFLKSQEETNPVLSPVSAYLALSLAGTGARGETAQEFEAVLGDGQQAVAGKWMNTLPADSEGTQVMLANSAWVDERMECNAQWLETAANLYRAEVYQTKLSAPETVDDINFWIEDNTKGLIKNFLDSPMDETDRLALFNTVYFKGKWRSPFEGESTHDHTFTLEDGTQLETPMMRKYNKDMSYISGADCDGVVLPYRDSDLVFVALKPIKGQTVRQLCSSLDFGQVGKMVDDAQIATVDLLLPKFEVSFDRELTGDMKAMGLVSAFDPGRADFTGIGTTADNMPLYIGLVRQKAVFKLDEEGTEAAAVTEIMMRVGSAMPASEPIEVHFDKPFLYMIFDQETDVPLFVGIMDDPSQAQGH